MVDGEAIKTVVVEDGYYNVEICSGVTEICVFFPSGLELSVLPDRPELFAVKEGPIVLAGLCESDKGIYMNENIEDVLKQQTEHTYSSFPWLQSTYRTVMQPENLTFMPLYDVTDEQYTLYFTKKCK